MLYESVFAKSDVASRFHIHGIHPRRLIPVDVPLSTIQLETPTVVVVEYSDDAPDLLEMFSSVRIPIIYTSDTSKLSQACIVDLLYNTLNFKMCDYNISSCSAQMNRSQGYLVKVNYYAGVIIYFKESIENKRVVPLTSALATGNQTGNELAIGYI